MTVERLDLAPSHWEEMRQAVMQAAPEEACGLLGGRIAPTAYAVSLVIPITNALHSPVRYRMEPGEQLQAFERLEQLEMELVGIYHSHPLGPAQPSATDLEEAYYPGAIYLIWSGATGEWTCRAFSLQDGKAKPVTLGLSLT